MTREEMETLADMLARRLLDTFAGRLDMIEDVVFADEYTPPAELPDIGPMDKEWTIKQVSMLWGLHHSSVYQAVEENRIHFTLNCKGHKVITTRQMVERYGYPENQQPAITVASDGEANADAVSFSSLKRAATKPRKRKDLF